jgi:RHS repeat-associated protein
MDFLQKNIVSYNLHGNVDTLLQDFNEGVMKATGNRFKKMVYDYDLISGKVNKVSYQADWEDEFYHKYFYDAENRLTDVYSSTNGLLWQKDARYSYYRHGPLAKTILGQNQVQGIDYAYTLQGWLKGVNSTAVDDGKFDMGEDGLNAKSLVARDAFGFGLHYFGGDYKAINNTVLPFAPIPNLVSLYNGNIAAMSVNTPKLGEPLLTTYKYDQLQRLTKVNTYKGLNPATNNWNVVSIDDYREELTYDPNGNIQTYKRNGTTANNNPLAMDNMNYNYYAGTNKLNHIKDAVPKDNYPEDLDDQKTGNYKYDAIGNLISDSAENTKNISWNVYGKMLSIDKKNGDKINYGYDAANNRISETFNNERTFYVRDASGNTMSTYVINDTINNGKLTQSDVHLYGSSRLGVDEFNIDVHQLAKATNENRAQKKGSKKYELTDHRGNVIAVVGENKTQHDDNNDGIIDYYTAQVLHANDSYSFGLEKPFRTYGIGNYAYSYNGKKDDKKARRGYQNYGWREYDKLTSRFISVDPISAKYPELTPYQFASNRPIELIDIDGLEGGKTIMTRIWDWMFGGDVKEMKEGTENVRDGVSKQAVGPWDNHIFNEENPALSLALRKTEGQIQAITGTVQIGSATINISNKAQAIVEAPIIIKDLATTLLKKPTASFIKGTVPKTSTAETKEVIDYFNSLKSTGSQKFGGRIIIVDENLSPKIASQLTNQGYNVKTFARGTLDPDIIKYAQANNSIVVTNNIKHFKNQGITTMKVTTNMKKASEINNVVKSINNVDKKALVDPSIIQKGNNISLAAHQ